eukprot:4506435-Alexandrium_andersonii.AAC.1
MLPNGARIHYPIAVARVARHGELPRMTSAIRSMPVSAGIRPGRQGALLKTCKGLKRSELELCGPRTASN